MQNIAAAFAASVKDNAVPYAVTLDQYSILDLPAPPNFIDLQQQMDVLAFCARQRNAIWTSLNNLDFILANLSQFVTGPGTFDIAPLVAYRTALEADLTAVARAASVALDHPKDAVLPVLTAQPPPLPERRAGEKDALADVGAMMANANPLVAALRDAQPVGPARNGFFVGLATEAANTAWGPGAESIKNGLDGGEQVGFSTGAFFSLDFNSNKDLATRGAKVVDADPEVRKARESQPPSLYWLGFDIGTGLFGDPILGAVGNTLPGPGSDRVKAGLHMEGKQGFEDARLFNVSRRR
jgi:hypothetical protein